jgi:hypothetical protein
MAAESGGEWHVETHGTRSEISARQHQQSARIMEQGWANYGIKKIHFCPREYSCDINIMYICKVTSLCPVEVI